MVAQNAIAVRTVNDKVLEERAKRVQEQIEKENENPFQRTGDAVFCTASTIYNEYLYSSGVMLFGMVLWSMYPSFVRYRHVHIRRYGRKQLTFRRWFFSTPHLPKWDKKYLQRVVVPPPSAVGLVDLEVAASRLPSLIGAKTPEEGDGTDLMKHVPARSLVPQQTVECPEDYTVRRLSVSMPPSAVFNGGDEERGGRILAEHIAQLNEQFYSGCENRFRSPVVDKENDADIRTEILAAIKRANATVVLKESHTTVSTIPPGWELWWVSVQEAKRRYFCFFWTVSLIFGRVLQDLLDMPDMPDMIN